MDEEKHVVIKSIIFCIVGWIAFSILGMLSKPLSAPLPSFMQNYNSLFKYSGYNMDDLNKLREQKNQEYVESMTVDSGTFEKMGLFETNNLRCDGYYDKKSNKMYISGSYSVFRSEYGGSKFRLLFENFTKVCIPFDEKYIVLGQFEPAMYEHDKDKDDDSDDEDAKKTDNGNHISVDNWYKALGIERREIKEKIKKGTDGTPGRYTIDYPTVCKLLEKQRNNKIALSDFAALLYISYNGQLGDWVPEEHKAVFVERENGKCTVLVYNTQTMECEKLNVPKLKNVCYIKQDIVAGYDPKTKEFTISALRENKNVTVNEKFDGIKSINYRVIDEKGSSEFVIGFITDKGKAYAWDIKDNKVFHVGKDEYESNKLMFDPNGNYILVSEDEENFSWKLISK